MCNCDVEKFKWQMSTGIGICKTGLQVGPVQMRRSRVTGVISRLMSSILLNIKLIVEKLLNCLSGCIHMLVKRRVNH